MEFRVWDKIEKTMFYPEEAKYCISMIGSVCDDRTDDDDDDNGKLEYVGYRAAAMFYTGIKDKTGIRIYEEDILRSGSFLYIVVFGNGKFNAFEIGNYPSSLGIHLWDTDSIKVGNTYENLKLEDVK